MKIFILNDENAYLMEQWLAEFNKRVDAFSGCHPLVYSAMKYLRRVTLDAAAKRRKIRETYWKNKYEARTEAYHRAIKDKEFYRGFYEAFEDLVELEDEDASIAAIKRIRARHQRNLS